MLKTVTKQNFVSRITVLCMQSRTVAIHLTKLISIWLYEVEIYLVIGEQFISATLRFLEVLEAF
jgi:hypothetical protein